jgi:hypothetical protein
MQHSPVAVAVDVAAAAEVKTVAVDCLDGAAVAVAD